MSDRNAFKAATESGATPIPDGVYYDDYDRGTWLVFWGGDVVADGLPTEERASRVFLAFAERDRLQAGVDQAVLGFRAVKGFTEVELAENPLPEALALLGIASSFLEAFDVESGVPPS